MFDFKNMVQILIYGKKNECGGLFFEILLSELLHAGKNYNFEPKVVNFFLSSMKRIAKN